MKRIHIHWTAGRNTASSVDRQHYHFMIEGSGKIVTGIHTPEDNINCNDGNYAAHTLGANTDAIGIALCGMIGAKESPFESGPYPFNIVQWNAMTGLIGGLMKKYKIKNTPQTVLTHAEVQGTLGIKQKGKWDITRIPFKPDLIGAKACGDWLRSQI